MKTRVQVSKKICRLEFLMKMSRDPQARFALKNQLDMLKWVKDP
jgi:hypothetical protein